MTGGKDEGAIKRMVLIALVCLASICDSAAPSRGQPSRGEAPKPQQSTTPDQRGTPNQPLSVNAVATAEQKAEADEKNAEAKLKAANDQKLIEYTGDQVLIGIVTFFIFVLQLIAFIVQACYMRRAAEEMRATSAAAKSVSQDQLTHSHKIERAYISGGGVRAVEFHSLSAHQTPIMHPGNEFEFHVNNYGKTAGTIYKVGYGFCDESAIPNAPSYTFDYWRDQITPGREGKVVFRKRIPPEFARPVVFGRFYYRTIFDTCHSCGFIYRIVKERGSEPISAPSMGYIQEQDESCDDADPL